MSPIFKDIAGFLKDAVGNNMNNDPTDVRIIKKNLNQLGLFNDDIDNGYITAKMDNSIRAFQRNNDLREDGRLFPGGETERAMFTIIAKRDPKEVWGSDENDEGAIGFGGNVSGVLKGAPKPKEFRMSLNDDADKSENKESSDKPPEQPQSIKDIAPQEHYEKGDGAPIRYTAEKMHNIPTFANAMKDNRDRFESSIAIGEVKTKDGKSKKHTFNHTIINMKDGETITLNAPGAPGGGDYWDRDISRYEGALSGDLKQSIETGSVKLRSTGNFKATKQGNNVYIDGVVDHSMKDVYDFNKDDPEFSIFRKMAEEGHAKPYLISGSRVERVKGVLKIENGKVVEKNFEWIPVKKY